MGNKSLVILLPLLWDLLMISAHLGQSLQGPFSLTYIFAA